MRDGLCAARPNGYGPEHILLRPAGPSRSPPRVRTRASTLLWACAALWLLASTIVRGDPYEPNDSTAAAYDLRGYTETWLSGLLGKGLIFNAADTDYFKVTSSNGFHRIQINFQVDNDPTHNQWLKLRLQNGAYSYWRNFNSVSNGTSVWIDLQVDATEELYIVTELDSIKSSGSEQIGYNVWWNLLPGTINDPAEYNDIEAAATDLTAHEDTYVSDAFGGTPAQGEPDQLYDYDYFRFNPPSNNVHVRVEMPRDPTRGSINLFGYQTGGISNYSAGFKNLLYFDTQLTSTNPVYLRVYGHNWGTPYDLRWQHIHEPVSDDALEENDALTNATDTAAWYPDTDIYDATGSHAKQYDDDYYELHVSYPEYFLTVTANFNHALGDMDLSLYSSNGTALASATSTNSGEALAATLTSAGSYYVRVHGEGKGNPYNLSWETTPPPSDLYVESFTEVERAGHFDGRNTPGDTIEINPTVRNAGAQPGIASNVVGTLVSTSAYITIEQEFGVHSNILAQLARPAFPSNIPILSVAAGCPGGFATGLKYLIASDNAGTVTDTIHIVVAAAEDAYEENDALDTATLLPQDTPLAGISGTGTQADDDWYKVQVTEAGWLYATCTFTHIYGDLALALFDDETNTLESASTATDDEDVAHILYPGDYWLRVTGEDRFSDYDLAWTMGAATPPQILLVTNAITAEDLSIKWDDDGEADPGETVTLSFTIENTGELRATNLLLSLAGGDADAWPVAPTSIPAGTLEAGASATHTGLNVTVDWDAIDASQHAFELIATSDNAAWTNEWSLEVKGLRDDNYEYNSAFHAASTNLPEGTWLSTVDGPGRQVDHDYYRMTISNPSNRHYLARTDHTALILSLRSTNDTHLATHTSDGTNLVAQFGRLEQDPVLVRVQGPNAGDEYDLYWETLPYYADFISSRVEEAGSANQNGLIDPGEEAFVFVVLSNLSTLAYPAMPVTLSSASPDIAVIWGDTVTAPFAGGGVSSNDMLGFKVQVDSGVSSNEVFYLTATCDQSNDVVTTMTIPITISAEEDAYEPNDSCGNGYSLAPDTWLSSVAGPGIQAEPDFYLLQNMTQEYQYVTVTCTFSHAEGNIDFDVYGTINGTSNNIESVNVGIPWGDHCIKVYGENLRNEYDLYYSISNGLQPNIVVVDYGIYAEGGPFADHDGEVDPGEQIEFWLNVTNTGDFYMHAAGEDLRSDDPRITYADVENPLGSVPPRSGVSNHFNIAFTTTPNFPPGQVAEMDVVFEYIYGGAWTQTISFLVQGIADDNYEPGTPDLPHDTWLSSVDGLGVQRNEDRYLASLLAAGFGAEYKWMRIESTFNAGAGDIDLALLGPSFAVLATGTLTSTGEVVETLVNSGNTYLQLTGDNAGNTYDLVWNACDFDFAAHGDSVRVEEYSGNGDGHFSAGETGSLHFVITNLSCVAYPEVVGVMTSANAYLVIETGTNSFAEMSPSGSAGNTLPYLFSFPTNTPVGHTAYPQVNLSAHTGSVKTLVVGITAQPSEAHFATPAVILDDDSSGSSSGNGDGILNANELVELSLCLTNIGGRAAEGLSVTMSSTTATANVIWNWRWYNDVNPGNDTCTAPDGPFLLNPGAPPNDEVHLRCEIEFDNGRDQVFDLYLPVVVPAPAEFARPGLRIVDDNNGDGIIDPGEAIDMDICLTNIGDAVASDPVVVLTTTTTTANIIWHTKYYNDIPGGGSTCLSFDGSPFKFAVEATHPVSESLHLRFDVSSTGGDDQVFVYHLPISSTGPASPTGLVINGPSIAIEVSNTWYSCYLQYDDLTAVNVSTSNLTAWTSSHQRVDIYMDGPQVHIHPNIVFSNQVFDLVAEHDGWSATSVVTIIDQPFPNARYDFQNAAPGAPPNGWFGPTILPAAWSVMAETGYSPTNRCVKMATPDNGLLPVEMSRSHYISAYVYLELWLNNSDAILGGHPTNTRNQLWFTVDQAGAGYRRPLCSIREDGALLDMNGVQMTTVATQGWYQLDLLYMNIDSSVAIVTCWYNNQLLTPALQPILLPLEEEQLGHFLVTTLRGDTLIDNVLFAVDPFPTIVESVVIDELLPMAEGFQINWDDFPALRARAEMAGSMDETMWTPTAEDYLHDVDHTMVTNRPTDAQFIRLRMLLPGP